MHGTVIYLSATSSSAGNCKQLQANILMIEPAPTATILNLDIWHNLTTNICFAQHLN